MGDEKWDEPLKVSVLFSLIASLLFAERGLKLRGGDGGRVKRGSSLYNHYHVCDVSDLLHDLKSENQRACATGKDIRWVRNRAWSKNYK